MRTGAGHFPHKLNLFCLILGWRAQAHFKRRTNQYSALAFLIGNYIGQILRSSRYWTLLKAEKIYITKIGHILDNIKIKKLLVNARLTQSESVSTWKHFSIWKLLRWGNVEPDVRDPKSNPKSEIRGSKFEIRS